MPTTPRTSHARRTRRLGTALVAALLLPLFPVSHVAAAAAPVPAAKVVVSIPLSSTWNVSAYTNLSYNDGVMTCTWRSLVRVAPKPATAVTLNCVGPRNAYGMAYTLTLYRRSTALHKSVTVRFARLQPTTMAQLTSYAPLEVPVAGIAANIGSVSMVGPAGWSQKGFTDGVRFQSPGYATSSTPCELWVLKAITPDPRAFAAGLSELAAAHVLERQLFTRTQQLFSVPLKGAYNNSDVYYQHRYGATGYGDPFVSLSLQAGPTGAEVKTTMIVIPTASKLVGVPVVANGFACADFAKWGVATELLHQSIHYAGEVKNNHPFDTSMYGMWGSTDGNLATADVYGANGHYIFAYAYNGAAISVSGNWYSVTYSFAGDGMYAVYGPVVAYFPLSLNRAPYSRLFWMYTEMSGTTKFDYICTIAKGTNPSKYVDCNQFWH